MSLEQIIDSVSYQEEHDLDTLLAQVQSLAAKADNAGRTKTLDKLRDLSYSIETADDTAKRLLYNVSTDSSDHAFGQSTGNALEPCECHDPHRHRSQALRHLV